MGLQVLVVEDDPLFVKLISTMLSTRGYAVSSVSSAEDAIETLRAQPFELLVTDLKMEGLGGVGLIRAILADRFFPADRVLVITGEPETGEDSLWVASQNIPILRKPFGLKLLLQAVDSVLQTGH